MGYGTTFFFYSLQQQTKRKTVRGFFGLNTTNPYCSIPSCDPRAPLLPHWIMYLFFWNINLFLYLVFCKCKICSLWWHRIEISIAHIYKISLIYHIAEIGIWLKFQSEFLKNSDAVLYYTGSPIMEKKIFTYCEFIQLVRHIIYLLSGNFRTT